MRWQALRQRCLSFDGAEETFPFGPETSVFKVAGKMFALSRLRGEPLSVSVKCDPLLAEQLRVTHSATGAGYHLNKRHWNTVHLDATVPDDEIIQMVIHSYEQVVAGLSKSARQSLTPSD